MTGAGSRGECDRLREWSLWPKVHESTARLISLRSPAEVVVQSYRIPLSAFRAADPAFVPARLDSVTLRAPKERAGRLAVAEFALAEGP